MEHPSNGDRINGSASYQRSLVIKFPGKNVHRLSPVVNRQTKIAGIRHPRAVIQSGVRTSWGHGSVSEVHFPDDRTVDESRGRWFSGSDRPAVVYLIIPLCLRNNTSCVVHS